MTAFANPFISVSQLSPSGSSLLQGERCLGSNNVFVSPNSLGMAKVPIYNKRSLTVQASGDGGRPSSASIFVGGFVLGGIVVGTLGCIYAPQISKALAGADRKDLMRKLPNWIYDEEKALELNYLSKCFGIPDLQFSPES